MKAEMEEFGCLLRLDANAHKEEQFISRKDDLFKNINGRLLVYIESTVPRVNMGHYRYREDCDSIQFSLIKASVLSTEEQSRFTVLIPLQNLFRSLDAEGIRGYCFMEDLYCHVNRSEIITKVLAKYTKTYMEVLELDFEDALDLHVISPNVSAATTSPWLSTSPQPEPPMAIMENNSVNSPDDLTSDCGDPRLGYLMNM